MENHTVDKGGSLKDYFWRGLFVLIPVAATYVMVLWLARTLDGILGGVLKKWMGLHIPGLGLLAAAAIIVLVGRLISTNMVAQNIFDVLEAWLLRLPVVRSVYKTVKSLTDAFSPRSRESFHGVALVEFPHPGVLSLGFITGRATPPGGELHLAVYVPSNHLYFGNTILVPSSKVVVTSLSVEEGMRITLSSGGGFPETLSKKENP